MIGLGVVQMEPVLADPTENRRRSTEAIYRAVNLTARLIVLPELCSSGYAFDSQEELLRSADSPRRLQAVLRSVRLALTGSPRSASNRPCKATCATHSPVPS